jgi:hypothetical protein
VGQQSRVVPRNWLYSEAIALTAGHDDTPASLLVIVSAFAISGAGASSGVDPVGAARDRCILCGLAGWLTRPGDGR